MSLHRLCCISEFIEITKFAKQFHNIKMWPPESKLVEFEKAVHEMSINFFERFCIFDSLLFTHLLN